jgi:2-hydroxy-3-oxopropionate reductase
MEKIGFIGLGIMGKPMSRNLLKAGYPLTVYDVNGSAVEEVVQSGATAARSSKAVAAASDIVITMLPDSPEVEAAVLGRDGVLEGARAEVLLVDMSTIAPATSRRLAGEGRKRGLRVLDAPVSGGDKGAIAGTLSIMVGGDAADFQAARKLFEAMGKTITHCGPHGAGQIVKACNQIVVALTIEAVSEALVLGSKAGVRPEIILQVLGGGLAQNRVMEMRGPNFLQHQFAPGFKIRLHRKDMGIVMQSAREFGAVLPVSALVDQFLTNMVNAGKGDLDHSALLTLIEELSDHKIGTKSPETLTS